jgi:hypothetical protein
MKRILLAVLALSFTVSAVCAREPAAIWFGPDPETPDYTDLFSKPELWPKARQHVDVILLGPGQAFTRADVINDLTTLQGVDAYRKLQQWNIDIAIDAPSVKEWDCSGQGDTKDPRVRGNALAATLSYIKNIFAAGAHVKYIVMEEPLLLGAGAEFCHDKVEQVAAKTAAYVKALLADPNLPTWAPGLALGDGEAYPRFTIDQHIQWIRALEQYGYKPAFYHLDVAVNYLDIHAREFNFNSDMQGLQSFLQAQGIPFGIIFWSGHEPEPTDASYYNHVVSWAQRVHAAIGAPEQSIIQSWVPRSSTKCTSWSGTVAPNVAGVACNPANKFMCSPADPPYCGKKSVPINLPENNPSAFSHTRLINTVTEILHGR